LVDLAEIERPQRADLLLERGFDAIAVELLPVQQAKDGIAQQHVGSSRRRAPYVMSEAGC